MNTPASYDKSSATAIKSFIVHGQGGSTKVENLPHLGNCNIDQCWVKDFVHERDEMNGNLFETKRVSSKNISHFTAKFW